MCTCTKVGHASCDCAGRKAGAVSSEMPAAFAQAPAPKPLPQKLCPKTLVQHPCVPVAGLVAAVIPSQSVLNSLALEVLLCLLWLNIYVLL